MGMLRSLIVNETPPLTPPLLPPPIPPAPPAAVQIQHLAYFRIGLVSGAPYGQGSAQTTLYLIPCNGNIISLYSGGTWVEYSFTESSLSLPATTATMYDVFIYNNAGTPTMEFLVWTNDTTRATALTRQDGVLVKSGDPTRRYGGSFRTMTSGETSGGGTIQGVFNYYNRVRKRSQLPFYGASWTYSSFNTWRAVNGLTTFHQSVMGVEEACIKMSTVVGAKTATTSSAALFGIGNNVMTTLAQVSSTATQAGSGNAQYAARKCEFIDTLAVGYNTIMGIEYVAGSVTAGAYEALDNSVGTMYLLGYMWN